MVIPRFSIGRDAVELLAARILDRDIGDHDGHWSSYLDRQIVSDRRRRHSRTLESPRKFVVLGPYRYVRNPMIIGVLFILVGEALLLHSALIAAWMVVFFLLNAIYFPAIEEKDLEHRFGNPYREYMKNVRRWIPRLSPWIET